MNWRMGRLDDFSERARRGVPAIEHEIRRWGPSALKGRKRLRKKLARRIWDLEMNRRWKLLCADRPERALLFYITHPEGPTYSYPDTKRRWFSVRSSKPHVQLATDKPPMIMHILDEVTE